MTDVKKSHARPDVEVVSGPPPSTSSKTNGHDQQNGHAESKVSGEKRKVDQSEATAAADDEGGKDLVEKKQTTLDDIVQHEEKDDAVAESKVEEEKDQTISRPTKKPKTDTEVGTPKKEQAEKTDAAATPPSQKSQTDAPGDRPHKSVKKVDDLKDKPTVSTPTKSSQPDGDVVMPASSSPDPAPARDAAVPTAKNGADAAGDHSTVPGDEAHLDHPENWTTGGDPATDKQKGFLKVLEKQKGVPVGDVSGIGKSEASEKIDELKNM